MKNTGTKITRANLRRSPVAHACLTFSMLLAAGAAQAGAGWGDSFDATGAPNRVRTYYAHTPSGARDNAVVDNLGQTVAAKGASTGVALDKFIDPLPGLVTAGTGATKGIPLAVLKKWTNANGLVTNDDYLEIAVIEYTEKLHSKLTNPTILRGYVQIVPKGTPVGSRPTGAVALMYPDSTVKTPHPITFDNGEPVYGYDNPHYLGPAIVATKGTALRLKFYNFLPVGRATAPDADGNLKRNGDLPIPVDTTLPGAGVGPDGVTFYTQNRAEVHLHGGDTPWISDGTPHQWITPGGEANPLIPGSLANATAPGSPAAADLPNFLKGVSQQNVPDMPAPEAGAATYYFPNNQSGRLMFYHDHSFGLTRLNVYMGEAAPYVLRDTEQETILAAAGVPGVLSPDTIPLVIQDKTFVPADIALQDGLWNNTNKNHYNDGLPIKKNIWGGESDLWYPHVYELNQDPSNPVDGTNAVGRWDWGPFFWPVFPALYNLPSGAADDVTLTPEAWMDTPVVNGAAYPTLTVDPTTKRFLILNAANDRMLNLSMFVANDSIPVGAPGYLTEVKMVAAAPQDPTTGLKACLDPTTNVETVPTAATPCWPSTWPTDGRDGGVPDPATFGPAWYQIGNEGGLLPKVATIQPSPMGYEYNRRSITVLNTFTYGLFMGNAERADVLVDFSQFKGKTLIIYNDSPAPVPAFDPRNDHWTGKADESGAGSVEPPKPGFGPNTRTVMQIKVNDVMTGTAVQKKLDTNALELALEAAYKATQEAPVVGQEYYNAALKTSFSDMPNTAANLPGQTAANPFIGSGAKAYANIFTGSLQEPAFKFVPGDSTGAFSSVQIVTEGSGYVTAPNVTFNNAGTGGSGAVATTSMRISSVQVTDPGAGYIVAPTVTITDLSGVGSGATGNATLKVVGVNPVTTGSGRNVKGTGAGYVRNQVLTLTFAPPTNPTPAKGGVQARGTVTITSVDSAGGITGLGNIVFATPLEAGVGYASAPGVTVTGGSGTGAKLTTLAGVGQITLTAPNPNNKVGGGGYTDLSPAVVTVTFTTPTTVATAATASAFGSVSDITLTNSGTGYTKAPTVTLGTSPTGTANTATAKSSTVGSILVKSKAIQELFDPTYGRMNATLGIELPFTSALTQTTIPLGYVDPISEEFNDGETQIWKITHNGVDSHPVHFHLVNVQVINRIGWDGTVKPPQDNERGWKETVKMHPLEDIMVAVRAKKPKMGFDYWNALNADGTANGTTATKVNKTPTGIAVHPGGYGPLTTASFGVPESVRLRDPSQPAGVPSGFTQINPTTGLPATITNDVDNYGWEYVWHCHILGHEENDFMRAIKFNANEKTPDAVTLLTASATVNTGLGANVVTLTWKDNAISEYKYVVTRASGSGNSKVTVSTDVLANAAKFVDYGAAAGTNYTYTVTPVGAAGSGKTVSTSIAPAAAANLTAPTMTSVVDTANLGVSVTFKDESTNETGFLVQRSIDGGLTWLTVGTQTGTTALKNSVTVPVANGLVAGYVNQFRVKAQIGSPVTGYSAPSAVASVDLTVGTPATVGLTTAANGNLLVTWGAATNATNYKVELTTDGGATWATVAAAATGTSLTTTTGPVTTAGGTYAVRVSANKVVVANTVTSAAVSSWSLTVPAAPAAATLVTGGLVRAGNADTATVTWTPAANASADTGYTVEWTSNASSTIPANPKWTPVATVTASPAAFSVSRGNGNPRPYYWFHVVTTNAAGSATSGVSLPVQAK